jgi:hypothetical protein
MQKDKLYKLANDLFFYYIDHLKIRDKCVIETDGYIESTDLGRTLYFKIVDTILTSFYKINKKNKWSLLSNSDIKSIMKQYIMSHNNKRIN